MTRHAWIERVAWHWFAWPLHPKLPDEMVWMLGRHMIGAAAYREFVVLEGDDAQP